MAVTAHPLEDSAAYARRVMTATAAEVRSLMGRRHCSQKRLGSLTGMSQAALSRRLNAETPFDIVELSRIASVLGGDLSELVRENARWYVETAALEPVYCELSGQQALTFPPPLTVVQ